ncbi:hypothetical protein DU508_21045 [Pedobacter chinensis]|uniref:Anti-sigma factor n=1 Tax=Pedobacter chinensis TaxID=2282421 RepID=A0A369PQA7_9SPHI|nr:hypothetical protein [Pedobacter chinensis]RDC54460.1 hypothetical protein DU508_21045 [Pedobacter chinensis]
MEIKKLIDSGLMETYVMGIATDDEVQQVLLLKKQYPEFEEALTKLELDMEVLAQNMAVPPPPGILSKIEKELSEIKLREQSLEKLDDTDKDSEQDHVKQDRYIEVESESSHIRIHKAWRWVFAAVFVLGKIFLGFAIYFYLENRQAQEQIKELKTEINHMKSIK